MTSPHDDWRELAAQLRVDSIRSSSAAGSGHPTSSMSAADLMAVLMSKYLHYDFDNADDPRNDHLIFSKGHASPLVYAIFKAAGAISDEEMLTFRRFGSRIEGHPTPVLPWVDVATGSLGQGLPISVGVALTGKRLDRLGYHVWCLCGDSEMAEGSMWEAFEAAAHQGLDNLTAIIDVNRLGQTGPTMHGWDLDAYRRRAEAFGWKAIEVDGHDVAAIDEAYAEAVATTGQPSVIIARTEKGHGVKAVADQPGKHGKPLDDPDAAIAELGGIRDIRVQVPKPEIDGQPHAFPTENLTLPVYEPGTKEATRKAFGDALVAIGKADGRVVAIDGEVGNSTYTEEFATALPERFFQAYIAEQQMVAMAVGMQVRDWKPFAATFAAFLARAYDFVRMAAVSRANISLAGSHAGVSIGEDGPSQMALEDLAAFRAVHGSTVLYPCDANQTAALVPQMADRKGIVFMRTTREKTPILYEPGEEFRIGGSRVVRRSGRRRGDAHRRRDHASRVDQGRRRARRRRDQRAGGGPVQREADRRGHDPAGRARDGRDHHRGGSLAGRRDRRGGAGGAGRGAAAPGGPQAGRARHARLRDARRAAPCRRHRRRLHRRRGAHPGAPAAARGGRDEMTNALHRLHADQDQSPWIDFIDRDLLTSGKLEQLVTDGIRGLTSNPTIFAKAVATGQYDELIRREIEAGDGAREIYEQIAVSDVGDAADVLRRVYDEADGADGFASIEVEPDLSEDTDGTVARARELWSTLERPNVFIKIPATPAGIPAIETAIGEGINVNVTLMFSVEVYREVARAYIAGLRRRLERGEDVSRVASVASFFVSRVDTKIDKRLDELGDPTALALRGRAGDREREAGVRGVRPDLRWRGVRRPASGRRAGPALPVGQHQHQESRVPRRPVRRGADRAADRRHHAHRDDHRLPGPRQARAHAGSGPRRVPSRPSARSRRSESAWSRSPMS